MWRFCRSIEWMAGVWDKTEDLKMSVRDQNRKYFPFPEGNSVCSRASVSDYVQSVRRRSTQ